MTGDPATNAPERAPLDIEHELAQIARGLSEADAARVRTLIYLASRQQTGATLPEPMSDAEIVQRLALLMRSVGQDLTALGWATAWPRSKRSIHDHAAKFTHEHLPPGVLVKISRCRDLPSLYKCCPELKQSGRPNGYPISGGPLERMEWCRKSATAYFVDRLNGAGAAPAVLSGENTGAVSPAANAAPESKPPATP